MTCANERRAKSGKHQEACGASWLTENLRMVTCTPASTASCRAALRMARRAAMGPLQPVAHAQRQEVKSGYECCTKDEPTCADEPASVCQHAPVRSWCHGRRGAWLEMRLTENQHAAPRVAKGQLHGREASGRVVGIRAPRADGVQVKRQRQPAARHWDCLCQLRTHKNTLVLVSAQGFERNCDPSRR